MYVYKRGDQWWYEVKKDGVRHRASCGTTRKGEAKGFAERMGVIRRAGSREKALALVDIFFPPEKKPGLPLSSAWASYVSVAKATGRLEITDKSLNGRSRPPMRSRGRLRRNTRRSLPRRRAKSARVGRFQPRDGRTSSPNWARYGED